MNDIEQELKEQVEKGYIKEDGTPLKCWKCESKELKFVNHYDEHICVEVSVKCKSCGVNVGLWSYGNWTV